MKVRKIPIRTCVGCNTARPKKELVRVVRLADGHLAIDRKGKVSGRGAYVCPDAACIRQAIASRRLDRALEVQLTDDIRNELERMAHGEG
ncbi:MAG: YlxR family protein [Thermaerobacter sp.]|nr:YlxR family protein [Thermaerobacter sp.]